MNFGLLFFSFSNLLTVQPIYHGLFINFFLKNIAVFKYTNKFYFLLLLYVGLVSLNLAASFSFSFFFFSEVISSQIFK